MKMIYKNVINCNKNIIKIKIISDKLQKSLKIKKMNSQQKKKI